VAVALQRWRSHHSRRHRRPLINEPPEREEGTIRQIDAASGFGRPVGRRFLMIMNGVIVGLDDSPGSRAAHCWAAAYAEATGTDLCAVHVLNWPVGLSASAVKSSTRLYVPKQDVAEPYWRGLHRVYHDISSPRKSALRFAQGDVGEVLVRLSANASLLVVGSRAPVPGRPYLYGSVSRYCISHASCPVVTVPESPSPVTAPISDSGWRRAADVTLAS
jgi:nucleotide-binding universal stress UspA family protein